jgi:hypothetical protein
MVRGCALDSGSLTKDTENVRITYCTLLLSTGEGEQIMVRGCALDSGSLTMDTEIVRISHCGSFIFQNRYHSLHTSFTSSLLILTML